MACKHDQARWPMLGQIVQHSYLLLVWTADMQPQRHPFRPIRRVFSALLSPLLLSEVNVTQQPIIEARGLKRTFKARGAKGKIVEAVRGIDLSVREGEIVGFL